MKRSQSKQSINQKNLKKQAKGQTKDSIKRRHRKNNENTASTLGSRSSMDSKFTKRKIAGLQTVKSYQLDLMKARSDARCSENRKDEHLRKLMLNLESNRRISMGNEEEGLISYREYCMMGNQWVPLLTGTQRDRIVNPVTQKKPEPEPVEHSKQQQQQGHEPSQNQEIRLTKILSNLNKKLQENYNQFQQMPRETKKHYYKLLKETIEKLQNSEQIKSEKEIELKKEDNKKDLSLQLIQPVLNESQDDLRHERIIEVKQQEVIFAGDNSPVKSLEIEQPKKMENTIQEMIKMRQMRQMGFKFNFQTENQSQQPQKVDTSIVCIQNYIKALLYVIRQTNLASQIVNNVKLAWGFPKKQKLFRIRHHRYLGSSTEVLPEFLFQYIEDYLGKNNLYDFIHNKSIFDCINLELNRLKPFFDSNGEAFPWNFKISSPLTFFEVEESTLPLAFEEIKLKLFSNCSILCGLMLPIDESHTDYAVLVKRRQQRQDIMFKKFNLGPQQSNIEDNCIEIQAIRVVQDVSEHVFEQLLFQLMATF